MATFSRDVALSTDVKRMNDPLTDRLHREVFERNEIATLRSNSWNTNEDFIAKAQLFYKLQPTT